MAFKLETLWYAPLIMAIAIVVIFQFYSVTLHNYGISGDTSKLGNLTTSLSTLYDTNANAKLQIQGGTITGQDAVNNMVQGAYTAERNNPFTVAALAMNATQYIIMNSELGINSVFYMAGLVFLSVTVVFALVYLVMRYRVF